MPPFVRKPKIGSTKPIDVSRIISFLDKESNKVNSVSSPKKAVMQVDKKEIVVDNKEQKETKVSGPKSVIRKVEKRVKVSKPTTLNPKFVPVKGDEITWL